MTYSELKEIVQKHCHLYYDLNKPEITDQEFDALYDKLEALEKAQGWRDQNSPTLKIGGQAGKVKHKYKLYSMKKIYDEEEITSEYDVETPKLDGTNLTLTYVRGNLVSALTRGDGEFGEDVSHLITVIKGIPVKVPYRGEIVINGECVSDNLDAENYRNYISGSLGNKDPEMIKDRNIRFIAHDCLTIEKNYLDRMAEVKEIGFDVVLDDFVENYPQDGRVFRINDYQKCKELGYTSKYPRFLIALKPRLALIAETVLQDVIWVVGRTGTVNPTGIVDPIILDGATVTRVTLHNMEFIENHHLGLGDTVEIERAGGVIPKFIRVVKHSLHNTKITVAHAEQAIGGQVKRVGPKIYVVDSSQHGTVKLLQHFIKTLGIKGLGPQSIAKLELSHPADLFKPQAWDALGVNGNKIIEEIDRAKTKPYELVLAALGIPGVGKSVAKLIIQHIPSFQRLRDVETVQIRGIGPRTIEQILVWLDENEEWVSELPLQFSRNENAQAAIVDTGEPKKVCITGKLDMTKEQMTEHLAQYGFEVVNTVTKSLYALISDGDSNSSKYIKAQQYGIKTVDYWQNRTNILRGLI